MKKTNIKTYTNITNTNYIKKYSSRDFLKNTMQLNCLILKGKELKIKAPKK